MSIGEQTALANISGLTRQAVYAKTLDELQEKENELVKENLDGVQVYKKQFLWGIYIMIFRL